MNGIKQSIRGNNNTQNIVTIEEALILDTSSETLTKSEVSELLNLFWNIDSRKLSDYDVSRLPSEVLEKLSYNNALRYKTHFENHALDYAVIKQVIEQYTNSQSIVCFIRDYYIKAVVFDEAGEIQIGDGNACLDSVFVEMKNHILHSGNFNKEEISDQKVESFCYGLLQYCIGKCKVLENVPDSKLDMEAIGNAAS